MQKTLSFLWYLSLGSTFELFRLEVLRHMGRALVRDIPGSIYLLTAVFVTQTLSCSFCCLLCAVLHVHVLRRQGMTWMAVLTS